jgi:dihydrolipoamide dehydrogenase
MSKIEDVRVPDIGDFKDVEIIEVSVKPGDTVTAETPLITLESDKATMEVPSPISGVVKEVKVKVGDKVSQSSPILSMEVAGEEREAAEVAAPPPSKEKIREGAAPAPEAGQGAATYGGRSGLYDLIEVRVPDIGNFKDVPIIEVSVKEGDRIAANDPLITLESDKASMEVPSPAAGVVKEMTVGIGDKVSEGSLILKLQTAEAAAETPAPAPRPRPMAEAKGVVHAEVLVLGSGPGGYTAAFRAADLGKKTVLVERYASLGGVCLNVGCIPSKALLHAAKVIAETKEMSEHGIVFGPPAIDAGKLAGWKESVVDRLTKGLAGLAKQRKVEVVQGVGSFASPNELSIATNGSGPVTVVFEKAIIAAGSEPVKIAGWPHDDPRVIDSTGALQLTEIPRRLLVIGGGIIGLEMATVYHELGTRVTVVELLDSLIPGADKDIIKPLHKRIEKQYENIFLGTKVTSMAVSNGGIKVMLEGKNAPGEDTFDRVLVAIGRRPNGKQIGAENAGVHVDERGFIPVDKQMRTNVLHIFAIGDIVGQPMLAHKATHEGKVAAEVAAGLNSAFDARVVPSVAYTDPEVAWVGVTETEAKQQKLKYGKGMFPWAASGRSLSLGRDEGLTKLIFDEATEQVIGAGLVGPNAGDLIAEVALAIETGCDARDIGLTIHPHPTLSETVAMAAEAFEGTITDLYMPRR